ncbi:hypothetical protein MtrunA17_Chr2g0297451 [Medicago truncatula]|uniref:Uncharacterized protein n=1 Tax=Medicago truncatula TaxID=3880 RepID=A0A072VGZ2_MEDTR|nr:hypothetical protein MTR_2g438320 [Medicago truncatula]RHN73345.1 hypothetical protein MtrunA17_Chr2g0297451 [Medicago truncatula]
MGKEKKNVLKSDMGHSGHPPAHATNSRAAQENVLEMDMSHSVRPLENTKPKDPKKNPLSNQKGYSPPLPKKK